MANLVRIKGKITDQDSRGYKSKKDGSDKTFYILKVVKEDGQTREVASFQSQAKLKNHYVEIVAEKEVKDGFTNYRLKKIKEQEGRLPEEPVDDDEEIINDEDSIEDDDGGEDPTPPKETKEILNTEQGKAMEKDSRAEEIQAKWDKKNKRDIRSIAISYAKDLCVGGKIGKDKIIDTAQGMFEYVWNGIERTESKEK